MEEMGYRPKQVGAILHRPEKMQQFEVYFPSNYALVVATQRSRHHCFWQEWYG
jgi:hypothetical protein